jgi:hypothetical protein
MLSAQTIFVEFADDITFRGALIGWFWVTL